MHSDELAENERSGESDLVKLNLVVAVLRQCHHALIQPVDETFLLNEICRILVNMAGYRLCFIGFSDDADPARLRMVACYGKDAMDKTIESMTWDETGLGSPASMERALKVNPQYGMRWRLSTRRHHQSGESWLEATEKNGFQSMLFLPLKSNEKTMASGIMALYSADPSGFNDDETVLLSYLARDIAKNIGLFSKITVQKNHPLIDNAPDSFSVECDENIRVQNAVHFFDN